MATVALLGTPTFNTTAGNKTVTATPTVGDLIVVIVAATGATTTVADNGTGGTYTQVDSTRTGFSTSGNLQVFIRDNLVSSAVSTIYTATQTSSTGGGLVVLRVTGMSKVGSAAVRSSGGQSTGTAATTPAPVLSLTPQGGNPIITAVANGTNSTTTVVQRTGYTEAFDNGYTTPATGLEVSYRSSGETSATITYGGTTASAFASVAIELDTSLDVSESENITITESRSVAFPAYAATQAAYRFYEDGTEAGSTAIAAQTTNITRDVTSDSNLQLRVRLQETNGGVGGLATDDYQLQYSQNGGTYYSANSGVQGSAIDSYSESNQSATFNIGSSIGSVGQSFTGDGNPVNYVAFLLSKTGSPSGTSFRAAIFTDGGTFGTSSVPTTFVSGAQSAFYDISTLTNTLTMVSIPLISPAPTIAGTKYHVYLEYVAATDNLNVGYDNTSPTHPGNASVDASPVAGSDLCFAAYTASVAVSGYNSASLTEGAATTNRLSAGTGSFLAGKISEDGLVDNVAITASNYTEHLYSLTLVSSALSNGDTLDFRVLRNGATTGMTYTVTPRITVSKTTDLSISTSDSVTITESTARRYSTNTLIDNFNDNSTDGGLWNTYGGAGTTVAETGGKLQLTTSTTPNYGGYFSGATYDLTGSSMYINLASISDLTLSALEVYFKYNQNSDTNSLFFNITATAGGTITAISRVASSNSTVATAAYNSTNHAWLRIREASGTTYFETSTDGVSYSAFGSLANPFTFTTGANIEIGAGTYSAMAS